MLEHPYVLNAYKWCYRAARVKELSIPDRVLFEAVREAPLEKFWDRRLREVKSVGMVVGESEQTDGSIGVIRNL